jgi:hypothetical protein
MQKNAQQIWSLAVMVSHPGAVMVSHPGAVMVSFSLS